MAGLDGATLVAGLVGAVDVVDAEARLPIDEETVPQLDEGESEGGEPGVEGFENGFGRVPGERGVPQLDMGEGC